MNRKRNAGKRIIAVTAHPDDEMGFGSVLAHYAGAGAEVQLVCLTLGQKGFRAHAGIQDGQELARVREEELHSSSRILGLEPPIVLEFVDQELLGPAQGRVRERLKGVLDRLGPDVVVTFGPEGATGHVDHRAVSCFVTEILQAGEGGVTRLFYFGLTPDHVAAVEERTGRVLLGVADRYLNTRIEVSNEDVERGIEAIGAYRSQFAPEELKKMQEGFRATTRVVYFRQVLPEPREAGVVAESFFDDGPAHGNDH